MKNLRSQSLQILPLKVLFPSASLGPLGKSLVFFKQLWQLERLQNSQKSISLDEVNTYRHVGHFSFFFCFSLGPALRKIASSLLNVCSRSPIMNLLDFLISSPRLSSSLLFSCCKPSDCNYLFTMMEPRLC